MNKNVFLNEKINEKIVREEDKLKSIPDALKKLESNFKMDPQLERDIQIQLTSIVSQLYRAALDNTEGYCYKFSLPVLTIISLIRKCKMNSTAIEEAFRADWKYPKNTHMYSD